MTFKESVFRHCPVGVCFWSLGLNLCSLFKQSLFSVENFVHYMTVSLEMLMNEVISENLSEKLFSKYYFFSHQILFLIKIIENWSKV